MAIRTQNKRAPRGTLRQEVSPRALLLAGLGAVSLGRKQAIRSIEEAGDNAAALRKRVDASVKSIETRARKLTRQAEGDFQRLRKQAQGDLKRLRKQAEGKVAALREQARTRVAAPLQHRFDVIVVEAANRIAPVIAKVGARPAAAKRAPRRTAKATRRAA